MARRNRSAPADVFSHRTRHVRMNAHLTDSETLVITFAPRATQADVIWGRAPLQKLGHSVLCFIDVADTWFPMDDMRELRSAVASRLGSYRRIVTYGHSMGGYGALKYGRFFSALRSVGLGPAWSVTPQDVGSFDTRRPMLYYRQDLHDGMAIGADDLAEDAIVVFDPRHREDRLHAAAIERAGAVRRAYNYFVGHDLMSPCVDTGNAGAFLDRIVSGEGTAGLRNTIRRSRSMSPHYVSRALDAMHKMNRFEAFRQRFAERHAQPLAARHAAARDVLIRYGYPVPDLPDATDWRTVFEGGSAEDAVKAAAGQSYSVFAASPTDVRRFLQVHSAAGDHAALKAFCRYLFEQTVTRADRYVAYADIVLKGGRSREHLQIADMLLGQAEAMDHRSDKLRLLRIHVNLMLRGEAKVPAHLFSSVAFTEVDGSESFIVPDAAGEFMRSRALDLGQGDVKLTFDIDGAPADMHALTCDVLAKNGRSLRPLWSGAADTARSLWYRFHAGKSAAPPAAAIRIKTRKGHEPRVNIILKSDGRAPGRVLRFHGVTVVRT